MKRSLVLSVVLLMALPVSGCLGFGEEQKTPTATDPPKPPTIDPNNTTPPPTGPVIPACTLIAGPLAPASGPAAPKPASPTTITIKTDAYGVSHIYADDMYSLWYGNGYVQARDRLFQLDVLRHVGYGDSASFLGPAQLTSDYEVTRDLYTRDELQTMLDAAPVELQQAVQAYSDGVNRFMAEAIAQDALPGEFPAIGRIPEPWTPLDTVASVAYLIGYFGVDGGQEIQNARLLNQLESSLGSPSAGWDAFADVDWLQATDTYTTISPDDKIVNGCETESTHADVPIEQWIAARAASSAEPFGIPTGGEVDPRPMKDRMATAERVGTGILQGFRWGSNALLVDGDHTATGKPIMFGAPQMGYYKPPVPYQIGLHAPGYDAVGIGVASAPGIVIGRNADLAWSVTSGIDDQVDTVAVPLDPDDPYTYFWDGQAKSMDCWTVAHRTRPDPAQLAGGSTDPPLRYDQEVCRIEGMPVVAINKEDDIAFARQSTAKGEELAGAWMWLNVPRQTTFDEVRDTLKGFPFTFNFFVASDEGIGYLHTGNVPLRAEGLDPRLPTPAGSAWAWRGEAYTAQMDTWHTDPSRGYYANWNNAPAYGWRTGDQSMNWGPAHRVQVLDRFVQERLAATSNALTWEDVRLINQQAATHDSFADHFTSHFIDAVATTNRSDLQPLADELAAWRTLGHPWRDVDSDDRYDDPAHAIYDAAITSLMARVLEDEMGPQTPTLQLDPQQASDPHAGDHGYHDNEYNTLVSALLGTSSHDWCNDVTTEATETCQDQLLLALTDAQAELSTEYGADIADWLLPQHRSGFTAIGGSNADTIPMTNRGSWVQIVAMGQGIDGAGSLLPPSNTGLLTGAELALLLGGAQAEPARLTAELDLYVDFEYKPFPLTSEEVDALATETLELHVVPV